MAKKGLNMGEKNGLTKVKSPYQNLYKILKMQKV